MSVTYADRRSRPLAHTVEGKYGGFVEWRAEVSAGGVGYVVVGEQDAVLVDAQDALDVAPDPQLVEEPRPHAVDELHVGLWEAGHRRHHQPFELHERLFEEHHVVKLRAFDPALFKAEADGVPVGSSGRA